MDFGFVFFRFISINCHYEIYRAASAKGAVNVRHSLTNATGQVQFENIFFCTELVC